MAAWAPCFLAALGDEVSNEAPPLPRNTGDHPAIGQQKAPRPSTAQTGDQAGPWRSLEIGLEGVHVHERHFVGRAVGIFGRGQTIPLGTSRRRSCF